VRIPASFCGVVGMKTTHGRVAGKTELAPSCGIIGSFGWTVRDCALLYATIAQPDPNSLKPQGAPVQIESLDTYSPKGLRIGIYDAWFHHADPEVVEACSAAISRLVSNGAVTVKVQIPFLEELRVAHQITIVSEMLAFVQKYKNWRQKVNLDTLIPLIAMRNFNGCDYVMAQKLRTIIIQWLQKAFDSEIDVLAVPSTAITAPPLYDAALACGESDINTVSKIMRYAFFANMTGNPAISVPVGYSKAGLPIGLQLIGRWWEESLLFQVAASVEKEAPRKAPRVTYDPLKDSSA